MSASHATLSETGLQVICSSTLACSFIAQTDTKITMNGGSHPPLLLLTEEGCPHP
jgi:hypothetical protein